MPASCININACPFPLPWQAACQSTRHLEGLATHNASALLPLIRRILANTRMHQWQTIFYIGYYFPERDVCAGAVQKKFMGVAGYIETLVFFVWSF